VPIASKHSSEIVKELVAQLGDGDSFVEEN
jgi:hypothetical protein